MPTRKVGRFTITEDHIVKKRSACDFETNTSREPDTRGIQKIIHSVTQAFDSPQATPSNRRIRSFGPRKPPVSLPQTTKDTPFSLPQATRSTTVSIPESTRGTTVSIPESTQGTTVSIPESTWGTTVSLPQSSQAIPVSHEKSRQETVILANKPIYTQSNHGPTLNFQSVVKPNQQFWDARTYTVSNQDQTRVWLYKADGSEADYSTRFENLHPDSQKCLLVIEERMQQYKKESQTIDECTGLNGALSDSDFDVYAATIHQDIRVLSGIISKLKPDAKQMILTMRNLMENANKAIFTYSNWKDKQTSSAYTFCSGFPMRPSPFLTKTTYRFKDDILKHCRWLQENEEPILMDSTRSSRKSLSETLHKLMLNVHEIFTNLAAKVEELHQTVELNRKRFVLHEGRNPFQEADRREIARKEKENAKFQNYMMPCTTNYIMPCTPTTLPPPPLGVVIPNEAQMQFGVAPSEPQMLYGNTAQFEDASFSTPPRQVMPSQRRTSSEFSSQVELSQQKMSKSRSKAVSSKQKTSRFRSNQRTGLNNEVHLIRKLFWDSSSDIDSGSSRRGNMM